MVADTVIQPIRLADMPAVTRMSFQNMLAVDHQFAAAMTRPPMRWLRYLYVPLHLWTSGRGFKAVVGGEIAGCAYLYVRRQSGYIFNVNVNPSFRRRGVGTALMGLLEQKIQERRRGWAALHVDGANQPARAFYEQLGYRSYRASYWQWATGAASPAARPAYDIRWHTLKFDGRYHLARLAAVERQEGDAWAAAIVGAEYMAWLPDGGRVWRVTWKDEEVGVVRADMRREVALVHLLFHPSFWGHPLLGDVLTALPAMTGSHLIDLHFGSSQHAAAAGPQLTMAGFRRETLPRLLLLKALSGSG